MSPTAEILRTRLAPSPPLHEGLDGWVHQGIGWWRRRQFAGKDSAALAARLADEHAALAGLPEKTLDERLESHRRQVRRQRHACLEPALAALPVVAEVARRELGLDPYPVQFQGAVALLRGALAEMATGLEAAAQLVYRAAWLRDAGKPHHKEAAMAKLFASECAARVADQAARIFASYGYAMEYPVQRFLRDVRFTLIGGGTSEILKLIIAKEVSTA